MKRCRLHTPAAGLLALALLAAAPVSGAILQIEDFSSDPSPNFGSRDSEMTVSHSAGTMLGEFAAQDVPFFESDAFRVDDNPWIGDYGTLYPSFTQFSFDFLSVNVLPSTFILRISDGTTTFIRNLLPQVGSVGVWSTGIAVPLMYDASWLGGSSAQFDAALASVSFIDIQIGRAGADLQQYQIDNFALLDDPIDPGGGGGPGSAVPEPNAVSFLAVAALLLYAMRRSPLLRPVRSAT
jgi:hypothetical protein